MEEKITQLIKDSEKNVKAVWEIDEITVYVTDIKVEDSKITVDWFTFCDNIDENFKTKVDELAKQIIKGESCSHNPFSRIWSTMKNIFA